MIAPVKIRITFPRRLFIAVSACCLLAVMARVSGSETVSVTLYYPPPIAAYQKLGAQDYLTIRTNTGTSVFYMGDLDKAVNTNGLGYGILLRGTNLAVNMNSCQTCSGVDQKTTIQFMAQDAGWLRLAGGAALGNVCRWVPSALTPTFYGALTPSFPWTWMGNGNVVGTTYAMSPTGSAAGFWCRMDAVVTAHLEEEPPQ